MKKTKPILINVEVIHDADGLKYNLVVRELFDAIVLDKAAYPKKTATYLVKGVSEATEMTASPRLAQLNARKLIYTDHYTNADGNH